MFWQVAFFYHSSLEMVKKQCQVWSPIAQTPPLSTRLTARPIWDKTKNGTHEMHQISHEIWSPVCTNSSSLNKANCKTYLDKNKNKDFMKTASDMKIGHFYVKTTDFHVKIAGFQKMKDHLQGIVTLMFSIFLYFDFFSLGLRKIEMKSAFGLCTIPLIVNWY